MNLSPFPSADDVVCVERHAIKVAVKPGTFYTTYTYAATFQGNDRPALTAYGAREEDAVASLYNALVDEYEYQLEQERGEEL